MLSGRTSELKHLNTYYDQDGSQIMVVYGQRNIGKTALLRGFVADKPYYYYRARSASCREQRYEWGQELGEEEIRLLRYPTYTDIFQAIIREKTAKKVIIIDEFQYIIKSSEDFMKELAQSGLPLEVSPTSNVFTKHYVTRIKDHPFKKLFKAGINVTLNTDDPTFFKVNLIDEYWNVYSKMGLKLKDIKRIILNGFNSAFISDEEKKDYCDKVNTAWTQWFESHPKEAGDESQA